MDDNQVVQVVTGDSKVVTLSREAASMCKTIDDLIGDLGAGAPVPVSAVTEVTMLRVKKYTEQKLIVPNPPTSNDPAKKHEIRTDDILPWDKEFVDELEQSDLFDLTMAANFLNCKDLLDLCCKTIANMIKGKSVEELRKHFSLANDFTPQEEAKLIAENEWCDEP